MNLTYTIFQSGEKQAELGLVVGPMPAGTDRIRHASTERRRSSIRRW
jgi:hypothetical protein